MTIGYKTFIFSNKNRFKYCSIDQNGINPLSSCFQYGKGVFTTAKYVNGTMEYYADHISRLEFSCKHYGICFDAELYTIIQEEIQKLGVIQDTTVKKDVSKMTEGGKGFSFEEFQNHRIKIIVSYISSDESYLTLIIEPYSRNLDQANLIVNPVVRGNEEIYRHKTCNYLAIDNDIEILKNQNSMRQKNKAKTKTKTKNKTAVSFDQWLYVNFENKILEASYSNIFFIRDNVIVTPHRSLSLLPGIVRNKILALQFNTSITDELRSDKIKSGKAKSNKFVVNEAMIDSSEIQNFEAVFITNSLIGCVPVAFIENKGELIPYDVGKSHAIINEIKVQFNIGR